MDIYRYADPDLNFATFEGWDAINPTQRFHRIGDRRQWLSACRGRSDIAVTVSAYGLPRSRTIANVRELTCCFLDLDIHRSKFAPMAPEGVLTEILNYSFAQGIPEPSGVVFSGRGIHVYWIFKPAVPCHEFPRWRQMQEVLADKFAPFSPDRGALDASRCLRAVGSINPKSGKNVRLLFQRPFPDYDFELLAFELLPSLGAEVVQARARTTSRQPERRGEKVPGLWTPADLWFNRLSDMRKLIALRGWSKGVPEGERHTWITIGALAVSWGAGVQHPERIAAEVRSLAAEFAPGLPKVEVARIAAWGQKLIADGRLRGMRNDRIIARLGISEAEQRSMDWLQSSEIRRERRRRLDRERKRNHCDRATYEGRAASNREQAHSLRAEGLTRSQIAASLGISVHSVASYFRNV